MEIPLPGSQKNGSSITWILDDRAEWEKMANASTPYEDGQASVRIADVIERGWCEKFDFS